MADHDWFDDLADATRDPLPERAPASLKSRAYSALVTTMTQTGPLLDLSITKAQGRQLCVFEQALTVLPQRTGLGVRNPCRICHARVLGEHLEHAPIFWPGCPYSEFHNG